MKGAHGAPVIDYVEISASSKSAVTRVAGARAAAPIVGWIGEMIIL